MPGGPTRHGHRVRPGALLAGVLLLDLTLVVGIGLVALVPGGKLVLRDAMFGRVENGTEVLSMTPEELVARGFQTDPAERVQAWTGRVEAVPYRRDGPDLSQESAIQAIRTLVPLFSKNGGGACGEQRDLEHQLERLPEGNGVGCCSDHTQVLMAHAATLGIFTREVHHGWPLTGPRHTTAEFFVPELGDWVWVDPQYAVMAADEAGALLSLAELRARRLAGEPVRFVFIGNSHHRFATSPPLANKNYADAEGLRTVGVTWGNAVFSEEAFDERTRFLPKPARRFLGLAAGWLAPIHYLQDPEKPDSGVALEHSAGIALRILLPALALATFAALVWWARSRRGGGSSPRPSQLAPVGAVAAEASSDPPRS